ncbi:hypothetical protein SETIT_4G164000v2 [Setaria italica]|uniref:Uncharacterized protein n=2 Tax=Setaria TaxID=4554 RepID=K3Y4B8_SETIT|nr:hypothetical protein SETIT_4G164000v2 [Setaria italica]TKW21628.1 hypothetical protein SEVIR_4G131900v2 [Setaria viridis]
MTRGELAARGRAGGARGDEAAARGDGVAARRTPTATLSAVFSPVMLRPSLVHVVSLSCLV